VCYPAGLDPCLLKLGCKQVSRWTVKNEGASILLTRRFCLSTCLPIDMLPIYPEGLGPLSFGVLLYWAVSCTGKQDDVCDIYPAGGSKYLSVSVTGFKFTRRVCIPFLDITLLGRFYPVVLSVYLQTQWYVCYPPGLLGLVL
jgi:hypothetical protein